MLFGFFWHFETLIYEYKWLKQNENTVDKIDYSSYNDYWLIEAEY